MKITILLVYLLFMVCRDGFAAEGFPLPLLQAIQIALHRNPDIQIEKETIRIREAAELSTRAQSDGAFRANGEMKRFVRSTTSLLETGITPQIERSDLAWSLGWKKPFPWGGEYDLTVTTVRTNSTFQAQNPVYAGDLVLTVTQPFLKGRGIQTQQTRIAQTDVAISQHTFRARVGQIIHKIIVLYWDLVYKRENLKVQQSSLDVAQRLLHLNKTKVDLGVLAPIEVLVAEVSVATREENVIIAKKEAQDAEEQLQSLIQWDPRTPILPTDTPIEEEISFDLAYLVEQAMKRPEITAHQLRIQNYTLSTALAESQLRPSLDFMGVVGPSGVGRRFTDSFDQFSVGSFYRWEAGFFLTYPLGHRMAMATVVKARAEKKQAELEKEKRINQIRLDVAEGHRRIETDYQRILVTRRALNLAKRQHAAGEERFRLGLLSVHDLIQFQNEVTVQAGNALRAVMDYNKALTNLYEVTGLLLSKYSIEVVP